MCFTLLKGENASEFRNAGETMSTASIQPCVRPTRSDSLGALKCVLSPCAPLTVSYDSAYFYSTATLNSVRSLLGSGFASLRQSHPRDWSLAHVRSPSLKSEFERITEGLADALDFSTTIGATSGHDALSFEQGGGRGVIGEVDFYTSHEGLMLGYEEALTRSLPVPHAVRASVKSSQSVHDGIPHEYYNTSAHFVWIGDRTRQLTGAHVEYFRGIRNPIGIKVGPSMAGEELVRLLDSMFSLCAFNII